ncbi:MAG: ethanolamine utilization protein EutN [Deltaproteobacteria bacterium]|nr:MAG: ethanolamine utilization protein EutN [Deltaproteobacteria bacterium]
MELARVIGRVVATVKYETLEGVRLLVIQPQDAAGAPQGEPIVAADALQAGPGDLVSWVTGREACLAIPPFFAPLDATIVEIVDHAWRDRAYLDEPWPPGGTGGGSVRHQPGESS